MNTDPGRGLPTASPPGESGGREHVHSPLPHKPLHGLNVFDDRAAIGSGKHRNVPQLLDQFGDDQFSRNARQCLNRIEICRFDALS